MWMSRYPISIEIAYDQGKEFIGHEFRKSLNEVEYGITAKQSTLGNTMYNEVLERIHQVLGKLVQTFNISKKNYVEKKDPWLGILYAEAFAICSTNKKQKVYILGQLVFGSDMIIPIKHKVDWELIHQQK